MSDQITTSFVTQFGTNVAMLAQQTTSRLRGAVQEGAHVGEAADFLEQFGEADVPTTELPRNSDTPNMSVPQDRRWVYPTDIDWGYLIDSQDKLRSLIDPTSPIAQAAAAAMNRQIDDTIISAFFGTCRTGQNAQNAITFPSGNVVANTVGASAATGMNVAKLREARRLLRKAEIDFEAETVYCSLCADKEADLLNDIFVVSKDFNSQPVLEDGRLSQYLGIRFIHSERFVGGAKNGNGTPYQSAVWVPSGMHLGIWRDLGAEMAPRPDKRFATQLYTKMTIGASRREEARVIQVLAA